MGGAGKQASTKGTRWCGSGVREITANNEGHLAALFTTGSYHSVILFLAWKTNKVIDEKTLFTQPSVNRCIQNTLKDSAQTSIMIKV